MNIFKVVENIFLYSQFIHFRKLVFLLFNTMSLVIMPPTPPLWSRVYGFCAIVCNSLRSTSNNFVNKVQTAKYQQILIKAVADSAV